MKKTLQLILQARFSENKFQKRYYITKEVNNVE